MYYMYMNVSDSSAAERSVLVGAGEIFLRKVLQVDTFSKKGDPTEPKTLVNIAFGCTIHRLDLVQSSKQVHVCWHGCGFYYTNATEASNGMVTWLTYQHKN